MAMIKISVDEVKKLAWESSFKKKHKRTAVEEHRRSNLKDVRI